MRILVADDDPTSQLLLRATVSHFGHECLAAADGAEAWHLVQAMPFEVVISDWMMPGLTGLELCRKIRADPQSAGTYFILLTGRQSKDEVSEGLLAGADAHISKPLDRAQLKSQLDIAARVYSGRQA